MIRDLDNLLRHLLTQVNGITEERVRFQPPDEAWRMAISNTDKDALNVYLFDLRENRKLRSNERVRKEDAGQISEQPAPERMDCHYLISAWSPAQETAAIEPTLDEHALLYAVTAVLLKNAPLNPAAIYKNGQNAGNGQKAEAAEQAWKDFWDTDLPTQVLPAEGFPKLAEFWGSMGAAHPWKPVIYLVVTLPVAINAVSLGPIVTTREVRFGVGEQPTAAEGIYLSGRVRTAKGENISGALIELVEANRYANTDAEGRYYLSNITAGQYTLRISASGYAQVEKVIQVPAQLATDYDFILQPG